MLSKEEFENLPEDQQKQLLAKMKDIQDLSRTIHKEDEKLPQLSMDQFKGLIDESFKKFVGQMDKTDKKFFMFPGIGTHGADDVTPEAKFMKTKRFLNALVGKDVQMLNTMHAEAAQKANLSEGTSTAGGFLVPEEFKAEILRLAPQYGVLRREARIVPMMSDTVHIPAAGTTDQTAHWVNEAGTIASTDPDFRQVTLTINKLASIPKVTNELLADANVNTVQYLAELISEAFAKEEDNQGFNGSGSPFVGVLQATGVPTSPHAGGTAAQSLSYTDIVTATGDLYSNALANAKFYFHRSMKAHLRGLITTAGAPILDPTGQNMVGYPLIDTEVLNRKALSVGAGTAYAIFGDLRRAVLLGERGSMTMKISDVATVGADNLFEQDMVALRMIERVALGVALPSSYTKIVTAAS